MYIIARRPMTGRAREIPMKKLLYISTALAGLVALEAAGVPRVVVSGGRAFDPFMTAGVAALS